MTWREIPSHEIMLKLLQRGGVTSSPLTPVGSSSSGASGEGISLDKIQELMGGKKFDPLSPVNDFESVSIKKREKTIKIREGADKIYLAVPYPSDLPPPPHPIVRLSQPNLVNLKGVSELVVKADKHKCLVVDGFKPIDLGKTDAMQENIKEFVCLGLPNSMIRYGNFSTFYVLYEDIVEIFEPEEPSSIIQDVNKSEKTQTQSKVKDFIKTMMIKSSVK